jgi:hypothetical protein
LDFAVTFRPDDGFAATFSNLFMQVIGAVAFARDGGGSGETIDKLVRMGDIVFLSGTADQSNRIAQSVSSGMSFRA